MHQQHSDRRHFNSNCNQNYDQLPNNETATATNRRYWLIGGYNCNYNKECACNIVRERKTKKKKRRKTSNSIVK
jgi:hypothetical protein